jgi:hypothetical protein
MYRRLAVSCASLTRRRRLRLFDLHRLLVLLACLPASGAVSLQPLRAVEDWAREQVVSGSKASIREARSERLCEGFSSNRMKGWCGVSAPDNGESL